MSGQQVPTTARAAEIPPLVMRCGAFGDIVLLTVLLRQLHLRFGKPVDVISSGPWTQPLLEAESAVGRLFIIRSRRTPYWLSVQQKRLVAWLRERGAGPTWFCDRGEGRGLLSLGEFRQTTFAISTPIAGIKATRSRIATYAWVATRPGLLKAFCLRRSLACPEPRSSMSPRRREVSSSRGSRSVG